MAQRKQNVKSAEGDHAVAIRELLSGVNALTKPDYHKLNVHAGRNDRLLHAVLCAYAKHHLDFDDIGWNQLGDILHNAICNEVGTDEYLKWTALLNLDNAPGEA